MLESGLVLLLLLLIVLSELLGFEEGWGVSQAAIASIDEMPRIINNFFID